MSNWQPIESAPEADDVLGFFPDAAEDRQVMIVHRIGGDWHEQNVDRCPDPLIVFPTHWMPLPVPPSAAPAPVSEAKEIARELLTEIANIYDIDLPHIVLNAKVTDLLADAITAAAEGVRNASGVE